jgi:hypothetical protein
MVKEMSSASYSRFGAVKDNGRDNIIQLHSQYHHIKERTILSHPYGNPLAHGVSVFIDGSRSLDPTTYQQTAKQEQCGAESD